MKKRKSFGRSGKAAGLILFIFGLLLSAPRTYLQAQDKLIQAGPMVGHTGTMETTIWVQTASPARISVNYWIKGNPKDFMVGDYTNTKKSNSNIAKLELSNLKPGTTYRYRLFVDDQSVEFDYPLEFKTQPLWQPNDPPPEFSMAIGSCLYLSDSTYAFSEETFGEDPDILNTIHYKSPDIMLWLGDNLYYRDQDFYSLKHKKFRWRHSRSLPEMQPLLASTINLAIWDDHDFGPNNSDRTYKRKESSLELFKRYWANPSYGTDDTKGVFTRYEYGDVEIFLLDDRYHRAPNKMDDPEKPYLGEAQLQWLKEKLKESTATFKLIANGNQITNRHTNGEGWTRFPGAHKDFIQFLKEENIEGVVLLSGDRHFSELLKNEREGTYPLYEFTSSPLTSKPTRNFDEQEWYNNPQRVDGKLVYKKNNFGMINVRGNKGDRRLLLRSFDINGKKQWEYVIHEDELEITTDK